MVADVLQLPNLEAYTEALFLECLKNKRLPQGFTPAIFTETLDHPDHFPAGAGLLRQFGTSSKTTYDTEYNATHVPGQLASTIKERYANEWRVRDTPKPKLYGEPHSKRLQMLCASHVIRWDIESQQLYFIMSQKAAPSLGWQYDAAVPGTAPPGDFHLPIAWLHEHLTDFQSIYFDQQDVATAVAQIGRRRSVAVDQASVTELLDSLNTTIGPISLENRRIKKGKLVDPTHESPFPRAGSTSITRDFEHLFALLNYTDVVAVEQALGMKVDIPQFTSHMNHLHLLILSLLQDQPSGYKSLEKLSALTHLNIPDVTTEFRQTVELPLSSDREQKMNTIDSSRGTNSLPQVLNQIEAVMNQSPTPGLGAARALLVDFTERKLRNDPTADQLEQLMQHFIDLVADPNAIEKLNIDALWE